MSELTPLETAALATAALRMSAPLSWKLHLSRWRARAASAFFQAGVLRHRRLFLSEIVADLEAFASASQGDPAHATRETSLLHEVDDEAREGVARYYEVAIALAPGFAESLYNLASLRRDSGRREDALNLFLRAARAGPHSHAKPHALVVANAFWEAADITTALGRLGEAEELFRRALALNGNFGPDHVRFPRLLRRLGKNQEALDHFERITRYSHRYAAEFVEPSYPPDETLPRLQDGTPLDPLTLTRINGGEIYYWAHLYFRFAEERLANTMELKGRLTRRGTLAMLGSKQSSIQCGRSKGALGG